MVYRGVYGRRRKGLQELFSDSEVILCVVSTLSCNDGGGSFFSTIMSSVLMGKSGVILSEAMLDKDE